MKIAYIMRGVPGSGKSTIARQLAGNEGVIHSTDDYFLVDGIYCFEPRQLKVYHDANYQAFCNSLILGKQTVICDNTNIQRWQFARYVESARQAGYVVVYVILQHPNPQEAANRNVHKVSERVIRRMMDTWED